MFFLIGWVQNNLWSQEGTFFITNSNTLLGDKFIQKATFCTAYAERLYYLNNRQDHSGEEYQYLVEMVQCDRAGQKVRRVNLTSDSLDAVYGWGDRMGDHMAILTLARTAAGKVYLRHRLYDQQLEVLQDRNIPLIGLDQRRNDVGHAATNSELFDATDGNLTFRLLNLGVSQDISPHLSWGLVYDASGYLIEAKHLEPSFSIHADDGLYYNDEEGTLSYLFNIDQKSKIFVFDKNFALLRTDQVDHDAKGLDTLGSLYGQYTNIGPSKIRFGLSRIHLITEVGNELVGEGRGIGYCDDFGRPLGKFVYEPLSIGLGSEGVPKYSGGFFHREGTYYTIYENWKPDPVYLANSLYITKYNPELEKLEEKIFVLHSGYRLANYWATLTAENAFVVCGSYLNVNPDNPDILTNGGSFVLGLSPDGSPPTLGRNLEPMIRAVFTLHGNPVSGQFELSTDVALNAGWTVSIYDIHGRLLTQSDAWQNGHIRISVADMRPGTYIYTVTEENRAIHSGKFIKQ